MSMFSSINKESMSLPGVEKWPQDRRVYSSIYLEHHKNDRETDLAVCSVSAFYNSNLKPDQASRSSEVQTGVNGTSMASPSNGHTDMSCLSVFQFSNFLVKSERGTDSNNHQRRMRQRPAAVGQSCLSLVGSLALSSFFTSAAHKGVNSAPMRAWQSRSLSWLWWVMLSKNIMCSSEQQQKIQKIGSAKWCFSTIPD